jgi:CRISPR system Cascade subunit CasB
MATSELIDRFVTHLEGFERRQDRGALAKLRRGAGRAPAWAVEALPLVVPFLPPDDGRANAFFMVAALFGHHPEPGGSGNFGEVFRRLGDHESAQKRFVALLNCHVDELGEHLRHAVTLARSNNVPIDFRCLLRDLTHWSHPDRFVQLAWARAYWKHAGNPGDDAHTPTATAKES